MQRCKNMRDGVRFAENEDDLRASFQLRYKVYVESMGRLKDKGDHKRKELRDEQDKNARSVIAIKKGQPIGTLRLFWGVPRSVKALSRAIAWLPS